MAAYILRRILFMIPTLLGIMLVSFVVVQFAPGGPVERVIAQISGSDTGATSRISGSQGGDFAARGPGKGRSPVRFLEIRLSWWRLGTLRGGRPCHELNRPDDQAIARPQ